MELFLELFQAIKNLNVDTVTAIATVCIAFFALVLSAVGICFSIWAGLQNRRHNRLSVTPYLMFHRYTAEQEEAWGLFLKNCGCGPAIIKEVSLTIGERECPINKPGSWQPFFEEFNRIAIPLVDGFKEIIEKDAFQQARVEIGVNPQSRSGLDVDIQIEPSVIVECIDAIPYLEFEQIISLLSVATRLHSMKVPLDTRDIDYARILDSLSNRTIEIGTFIAAGERHGIFFIADPSKLSRAEREIFKLAFKQVTQKAAYVSLYKEKFPPAT